MMVDDQVMAKSRFKPGDKGFDGAGRGDKQESRNRPVEFEQDDEQDPFGLDQVGI